MPQTMNTHSYSLFCGILFITGRTGIHPALYSLYPYFSADPLYNSLCHHRIHNFFKACDIGASYVVAFHTIASCCIIRFCKDIPHDALQLCVHFFRSLGKPLAVLAHLQRGGSYAACVGSLTRHEQHTVCLNELGSFSGGRHIGAFCHCEAAVCFQRLCIV